MNKFKLNTFSDFFFVFKKRRLLRIKLEKSLFPKKLKRFALMHKTILQKLLEDTDNTKALEYDAKHFASHFKRSFEFFKRFRRKKFKFKLKIKNFKILKYLKKKVFKIRERFLLRRFLRSKYLFFHKSSLFSSECKVKELKVKNFKITKSRIKIIKLYKRKLRIVSKNFKQYKKKLNIKQYVINNLLNLIYSFPNFKINVEKFKMFKSFFKLRIKKMLKISKLRRQRSLKNVRQFKKHKVSFRIKSRSIRRFFVHSMFFGRFIKHKDIKYDWNQYGTDILRTINFHEDRDNFFLNLKAKYFTAFTLNSQLSPITQMISRLSFLNSSFNFNIRILNKFYNYFSAIFKNKNLYVCFFFNTSLWLRSFVSKKNHVIFFDNFYFSSNLWLSRIKFLYFIQPEEILRVFCFFFQKNLFNSYLYNYFIVLSFLLKRGVFLFFSKLHITLLEFFFFVFFFSEVKLLFLNVKLKFLDLCLQKKNSEFVSGFLSFDKMLKKSSNKFYLSFVPQRNLTVLQNKNKNSVKQLKKKFRIKFFFFSKFAVTSRVQPFFKLHKLPFCKFTILFSKNTYLCKLLLKFCILILVKKTFFRFCTQLFDFFHFLPTFIFRLFSIWFSSISKKLINFKQYLHFLNFKDKLNFSHVGFLTFLFSTYNDKLKFFRKKKLSKFFKRRRPYYASLLRKQKKNV